MSEHHRKPKRPPRVAALEPEPGAPPVTHRRVKHRKRKPLPEALERFRTR
jgi:hypothetical protein